MPRDYTARDEVTCIVPVAPVSHIAKNMKNQLKQVKSRPNASRKNPGTKVHVYKSVLDPVCVDAATNPPVIFPVTTNGAGVATGHITLSPLGIRSINMTGPPVPTDPISFTFSTFATPKLPWLYNTAKNFQEYRVTRAVLIAKPILGNNATGIIVLASTTDLVDAATYNIDLGQSVEASTGQLSKHEIRHTMSVDNSWKKVQGYPFASSVAGQVTGGIWIGSSNDQLFSCGTYNITSAAATSTVVRLFVEYDVEFRKPVAITANQ